MATDASKVSGAMIPFGGSEKKVHWL